MSGSNVVVKKLTNFEILISPVVYWSRTSVEDLAWEALIDEMVASGLSAADVRARWALGAKAPRAIKAMRKKPDYRMVLTISQPGYETTVELARSNETVMTYDQDLDSPDNLCVPRKGSNLKLIGKI